MPTDDAQNIPADRVAEQRSLYGEQDEWGNSIADLRANLRLTYYERLCKAERSAKALRELLDAFGPYNRIT
jgi:hypothetical protein